MIQLVKLLAAASSLRVFAALMAKTVVKRLKYVRSKETAFLPTLLVSERTRKVQIAPLALKETRAVADSAVLNLTVCVVVTVFPAVPISSSVICHVGVVSREPLADSSQSIS